MCCEMRQERTCVSAALSWAVFLLGHLKPFPFWGNPWGGTGTPVQNWFRQV